MVELNQNYSNLVMDVLNKINIVERIESLSDIKEPPKFKLDKKLLFTTDRKNIFVKYGGSVKIFKRENLYKHLFETEGFTFILSLIIKENFCDFVLMVKKEETFLEMPGYGSLGTMYRELNPNGSMKTLPFFDSVIHLDCIINECVNIFVDFKNTFLKYVNNVN